MMPANYSAVNAEIVYGGAGIGDYLPAVWTTENVKTLSTNVVTIVGNSFLSGIIKATLGTMFGGNWDKDGSKLFGDNGTLSGFFKYQNHGTSGDEMNTLNKFMTVLGTAAAVYNLGTASVKNVAGEKFVSLQGYKKNEVGF